MGGNPYTRDFGTIQRVVDAWSRDWPPGPRQALGALLDLARPAAHVEQDDNETDAAPVTVGDVLGAFRSVEEVLDRTKPMHQGTSSLDRDIRRVQLLSTIAPASVRPSLDRVLAELARLRVAAAPQADVQDGAP